MRTSKKKTILPLEKAQGMVLWLQDRPPLAGLGHLEWTDKSRSLSVFEADGGQLRDGLWVARICLN